MKLMFLFNRLLFVFGLGIFLTSCGFHLQGEMNLVPPLHRLYLQTPEPYGYLARNLRHYFKLSNVELTTSPIEADTVLVILEDKPTEVFVSVNGTQQTRQYNLYVTVTFEITNAQGQMIVPPQTLVESRTITTQSNQILGNSNEANLYYQQMRRTLAYFIMNKIASRQISAMIMDAFHSNPQPPKS